MKPALGKTFRILVVREPEYQHLVGRAFVIDTFDSTPRADGFWEVGGRALSLPGSFSVHAILGRAPECVCLRLPYPHRRSPACGSSS